MPDFQRLLSLSYWFDLRPEPISNQTSILLFVFFVLLIVAGTAARIVSDRWHADRCKHRVWQQTARIGVVMGLVGIVVFFFLFENIQFFGARFWFLLWLIGLLVWIGWLVYYATHVTPAERARDALLELRNRYLPKRKK